MIELVSVEVKNFRSFGEATFAPLGAGQGLTTISGANGTGKSSIATHAVLWCLYGVTPDGVNVRALRKQDSEGEVVVAVTFRHDGQTVRVERSLRGKNDTTVASVDVDGEEQTSISSRTATSWVESRLGIDAESFMTAFVVRQKEVDSLVRARPAERRALIERLAGIDRLATALAKARETARRLSTVANSIIVTVDVGEAKTNAQEAQLRAEQATARVTLLRERVDEAAALLETAKIAADRAEESSQKVTELERRIAELRVHAMAAERERDQLFTQTEGADRLPDVEAAIADCRMAIQELTEAIQRGQEITRRANDANARAQKERENAKRRQNDAEQKFEDFKDAETRFQQYDTDLGDKSQSLLNHVSALSAKAEVAQAEYTRLRAVIATFEEHASEAACPTCQQPLSNTDALLEGLREDVRTRAREVQQCEMELKTAREDSERVARELEASRDAERLLHNRRILWEQARKNSDEQTARAMEAEETSETLAEDAHVAILAGLQSEKDLSELRVEERRLQAALRKAEAAQEALDRLPVVEAAANAAVRELSEAQALLAEIQHQHGSVNLAESRKALQEAHSRYQVLSQEHGEAVTESALAEAHATQLREVLTEAQVAVERKRTALADAEVATATASSIEEFRLDRLSRLAPELSEVASDIISTMTDGRYNAVELDEDFTPIVTEAATGQQRPTSWLSGGEESAVALALRLAIGDVVAGRNVGVLILDEVLSAHDKDRRATVMSAIRTLPHRQVITINHASETTDQVDLIATVVTTPEGSTIEHEAGNTPVTIENIDP